MAALLALVALAFAAVASAQPFQPGQGLLPLGNLRTVDYDGPYDLSLLDQQANEIKAGIAAKKDYTDKDLIDFLVNVECLEGLFDTWGVFGRGFNGDLAKGGPTPIGGKKVDILPKYKGWLQEVALNEQGHALFTRHAGSDIPCPAIDFVGGWNKWMAAAYNLPDGVTIEQQFGSAFDPFQDTQTFVTCVTALEELGATGNKGLIGLITNPVLANGVAGLATSATAQATVERVILWELKDEIIEPFGETVLQVFARVSALRDRLDGPQLDDQGLINRDPRFIAVPNNFVNMIPTDSQGLTFSRTPQMNLNILFLGDQSGMGVFFPNGLNGRLTTPAGFDAVDNGTTSWPAAPCVAEQQSFEQIGTIDPPLTGREPRNVTDMFALTQAIVGVQDIPETLMARGFCGPDSAPPYISRTVQVYVGEVRGSLESNFPGYGGSSNCASQRRRRA